MGNVVAIQEENPAKKSGSRKLSYYLESPQNRISVDGKG